MENIASEGRLHHTWKTGHFPLRANAFRIRCLDGSQVHLTEHCQSDCSFARLARYLLNEQLLGKLLSACETS
jgi:hypothetical protein